ncbi:hypothetical protein ACJMK2_041087 [Sinanodonta woodiana]|uniref:Uncharacterized protein n=1 Tax=Sinanodonta woodiana TaxID=1069815 RepID=A0ABD3W4B7_SINWO
MGCNGSKTTNPATDGGKHPKDHVQNPDDNTEQGMAADDTTGQNNITNEQQVQDNTSINNAEPDNKNTKDPTETTIVDDGGSDITQVQDTEQTVDDHANAQTEE